MTRLALTALLVGILSGCNVDVVLPQGERTNDGVATVVDLNARTQNRAIINGQ